jgi:hypothetical protein
MTAVTFENLDRAMVALLESKPAVFTLYEWFIETLRRFVQTT